MQILALNCYKLFSHSTFYKMDYVKTIRHICALLYKQLLSQELIHCSDLPYVTLSADNNFACNSSYHGFLLYTAARYH